MKAPYNTKNEDFVIAEKKDRKLTQDNTYEMDMDITNELKRVASA